MGLLVDLLCFCMVSHSYRIKYYILRNNVVEKVLKLLRRRERWLVVAAVRFLRTAVGLKVRRRPGLGLPRGRPRLPCCTAHGRVPRSGC